MIYKVIMSINKKDIYTNKKKNISSKMLYTFFRLFVIICLCSCQKEMRHLYVAEKKTNIMCHWN